jgi:hypothetical protein
MDQDEGARDPAQTQPLTVLNCLMCWMGAHSGCPHGKKDPHSKGVFSCECAVAGHKERDEDG